MTRYKSNYLLNLINRFRENKEEKNKLNKELKDLFHGRKIKITKKEYNGQPYGTSKPSLYGKIFILHWQNISFHNDKIYFFLSGHNAPLFFGDFEIVD